MVKGQLNKKERLGTWVLSQAPGRFLYFFGYFHAALESEDHFCLMHRYTIHCGNNKLSAWLGVASAHCHGDGDVEYDAGGILSSIME